MLKKIVKTIVYPPVRLSDSRLQSTFDGKWVVITGATSGIGEALTLRLIEARANLYLLARNEEKLKSLCAKAQDAGCEVQYTAIDLRDRERVDALCLELRKRLPAVSFLFANAGKSIHRSISNAIDRMHDFDRTMDLNYRATVALSLGLMPSLIHAGGQIIYTSSVSSLYPSVTGWSAYHASKCAANVWCRVAGKELKRSGVKVKIAYMPLVHTPMSDVNERYKRLPAYSADEAAGILLRLAISAKSSYRPWWTLTGQLTC